MQDLRRFLAVLEADHDGARAKLLGFRVRYLDALGPLMRELDELETQLQQATVLLSEALKRQGVEAPLPAPPRAKAWPDVAALPAAHAAAARAHRPADRPATADAQDAVPPRGHALPPRPGALGPRARGLRATHDDRQRGLRER